MTHTLVLFSVLCGCLVVDAAPLTFAQFSQRSSGNHFRFRQDGAAYVFESMGAIPVYFTFLDVIGTLPAELTGVQTGHVTLTATTRRPVAGTSYLTQVLDSGTLTITRDLPAAVGRNDKRNLLTLQFEGMELNGRRNGRVLTGVASTELGSSVLYTSDFLEFAATLERDFALSFSSVTPALLTTGGFLRTFAAAGTGTFDSDPPPLTLEPVPEPGTGLLLLSVCAVVYCLRGAPSFRL